VVGDISNHEVPPGLRNLTQLRAAVDLPTDARQPLDDLVYFGTSLPRVFDDALRGAATGADISQAVIQLWGQPDSLAQYFPQIPARKIPPRSL
jgi:hypothetical protein